MLKNDKLKIGGDFIKKSYKGFVLWLLAFVAGYISLFILRSNAGLISRLSLIYCSLAVTLLAYIIYKFDGVYWYNGVTFEDAEKAGFEKRQSYALKHLKTFAGFSLCFAVFTAVSYRFKFSFIIDIAVFAAGILAAALSTMKINLD